MAESDGPASLVEAFDMLTGEFKILLERSLQSGDSADQFQVRRILRARRSRANYFPAVLFADPAWDMLLELYLAELQEASATVSSLCAASNVPATTALRWIKILEREGLLRRRQDTQDKRRVFLKLTTAARDQMASYFREADGPLVVI